MDIRFTRRPFLARCERRTVKSFAWYRPRKSPNVNGPLWPLEKSQTMIYERDVGRGGGDRTKSDVEST
jgi:hypothetical protein